MHLEELNLLISNCKTPQFFQKILAHELTLKRQSHELKMLNRNFASSKVNLDLFQIDETLSTFKSILLVGLHNA